MIKFKSKTFQEYYEYVYDYALKFFHYSFNLSENSEEEYKLIEDDIDTIRDYLSDDYFKLYFGELDTLEKLFNNTNIFNKYKDFIYIRIRDNTEYNKMKSIIGNMNVKIIVEKDNLNGLDNVDNSIVVQVDSVKDLKNSDLDLLCDKYRITDVLLGQYVQLSTNSMDYYRDESKRFNIPNKNGELDYYNIEKNCMISNDIYNIDTYKNLYNKLVSLVSNVNVDDNEYDRFYTVYMNIVDKIDYNYGGFGILDNQNMYGGLINDTCVCEGFSKILNQALNLVDIDSMIVNGIDPNGGEGHVWNQVKIDNDWYNADASTDSIRRGKGLSPCMCLVDDSALYYKIDSPIAEDCNKTYEEKKKRL